MRMPETSSCMIALIRSRCACSFSNNGFALPRQITMQPTMNGNAHSTTSPNRGFSRNMKNILPKVSMVVRIMPRTNWDTKFCTCVMSFVTRVTREPVPKESTCGKENVMMFRKQSLRISLPMFCPVR